MEKGLASVIVISVPLKTPILSYGETTWILMGLPQSLDSRTSYYNSAKKKRTSYYLGHLECRSFEIKHRK